MSSRPLAILLAAVSLAAAQGQEIKPAHQYDFTRTLADTMGGPSMESGGGILYPTRYQFRAGKGPTLRNALASPDEYTIALVVRLHNVVRYRVLVNFDNLKHDRCLFIRDGNIHFYPLGENVHSRTLDIIDHQWHRVVFTRQRATATVSCYVDGTLRLSAPDPDGKYIADATPDAVLHFCRDDDGEDSPGELEQIAIHHRALTPAEIATLPPLSSITATASTPIPTRPARTLPAAEQQSPILPAAKPIATPPLTHFTDPYPSDNNAFGQTIVVLTNGNVVITAPQADVLGATDNGAVYLFNGSTHALISMISGTSDNDLIGNGGITPLANGNFVIRSQNWDLHGTPDVGAVTWANGTTGIKFTVTEANSLTGTNPYDLIGLNGVTALPNGNYVVCSAAWDYATATDAGAVTWADGATGISGPVTPENSLTGLTSNNLVGSGGAIALTNGNYVVLSPAWDNGNTLNVGAVTWASGTVGIVGTVAPDNSLTGTTAGDQLGSGGITTLPNSDYTVHSPECNHRAGANTQGDGKTGTHGPIAPPTK